MTRKPSSSLLSKFQSAQADVMDDVCTILRAASVTGTYSDDEVTISTGSFQIPCGFYFTGGGKRQNGRVLLVDYDVEMRLPVTQLVELTDRFVLVQKGTTVVSGTFYPTELPEIGDTALVVHLKRSN